MRGRVGWLLALVGWLLGVLWGQGALAAAPREVLVLDLEGPITPVQVRYLERGLHQAQRRQAEALIVQLDTPGGTVEAMQRMIEVIRNSPVPVVVYVAPRGARAASAGALLVLAAHVAAMAPETSLGAAAPVGLQGADLPQILQQKATNMLAALARSLAQRRGKQAMDVAERFVTEAYALTEQEALGLGIIDLVARDLTDLLHQLDGRVVETARGTVVLHTAEAQTVPLPMNMLEEMLLVLTNPNVIFLLLLLGINLLLAEISQPGGWVSGFLGVVLLALALYGLGALPVNWFGLLLIITAFVLFALEVKTPGFQGGLALAGTLSLIAGGLLLFNTPQALPFQRVSVPLVVAAGLVSAALAVGLLALAVRAQRRPVVMGPERLHDLVGRRGLVRTRITPTQPGTVQVAGELWTAEIEPGQQPVSPNTWVEVVEVRGSRLLVRPVSEGSHEDVAS